MSTSRKDVEGAKRYVASTKAAETKTKKPKKQADGKEACSKY